VGEPWLILIYALFAGVLLVYRLRGLASEREMLRVQAEAAASEQLALTFLRLSDYANTPIQTIAFATALLNTRNRDNDLAPILERLKRAVDSLKELSDALNRYQKTHRWSPGEESLDATMVTGQSGVGSSTELTTSTSTGLWRRSSFKPS
jgi:hypothetical protein